MPHFLASVVGLSAGLFAICWATREPPKYRRGSKTRDFHARFPARFPRTNSGRPRKYLQVRREPIRGLGLHWRASAMVAANKNLLREVRKQAIRAELLAMRTRGRLVVPFVLKPAPKPGKAK